MKETGRVEGEGRWSEQKKKKKSREERGRCLLLYN